MPANIHNNGVFQPLNTFAGELLHSVEDKYKYFPIVLNDYNANNGKGLAVIQEILIKAITLTGYVGTNHNWLLLSVPDSCINPNSEDMLCTLEQKSKVDNKWIPNKEVNEKALKDWKAKEGQVGNLVCIKIDKDKMPVLNVLAEILAETKTLVRTPGTNGTKIPKDFGKCQLKEEEIKQYYKELIEFWKNTEHTQRLSLLNQPVGIGLVKDKLIANGLWLLPLCTEAEVHASVGAKEVVERSDGLGQETLIRIVPTNNDGTPVFTEPVIPVKSSGSGSSYGNGGSNNNVNTNTIMNDLPFHERVTNVSNSLSNLVELLNNPHLETIVQLKKVNPDKYNVALELLFGIQVESIKQPTTSEKLQEENLFPSYPKIEFPTVEALRAPITGNGNGNGNGAKPLDLTSIKAPVRKDYAGIPEFGVRMTRIPDMVNQERIAQGQPPLAYLEFAQTLNPATSDNLTQSLYYIYQWEIDTNDLDLWFKNNLKLTEHKFIYQLAEEDLRLLADSLRKVEERNRSLKPGTPFIRLCEIGNTNLTF